MAAISDPASSSSLAAVDQAPGVAHEAIQQLGLEAGRRHGNVKQLWRRRALFADILGVGCAAAVAGAIETVIGLSLPVAWFAALILLVLGIAGLRGAYTWRMHLSLTDGIWAPLVEVGMAGAFISFMWTLFSLETYRPRLLLVLCLAVALCVGVSRMRLYALEATSRFQHRSLRPTLIIGAGRVGRHVARRLLQHAEFGLLPIAHLDADPPLATRRPNDLPIVGDSSAFETLVARYSIEQIVIAFSRASDRELLSLAERAAALGVDVSLVPRLYEKTGHRISVGHAGGLPLLDLHVNNSHDAHYARVKPVLDRAIAAVLLVLLLPVLAIVIAAVWASMGRPIFFRQMRIGRDGEPFLMLKMRTMTLQPDSEYVELAPDSAPGGVEGGNDRRTRVGKFLRQSSIDELPQLINVLKGEMSLIGPRPERPEFVREFNSSVDGYRRRHRVMGGITGWAQVHGLRGQTSISDRVEWDNYYIDNLSLALDLKILLLTFRALLNGLHPSHMGRTTA